jgi:hypothetical protein
MNNYLKIEPNWPVKKELRENLHSSQFPKQQRDGLSKLAV